MGFIAPDKERPRCSWRRWASFVLMRRGLIALMKKWRVAPPPPCCESSSFSLTRKDLVASDGDVWDVVHTDLYIHTPLYTYICLLKNKRHRTLVYVCNYVTLPKTEYEDESCKYSVYVHVYTVPMYSYMYVCTVYVTYSTNTATFINNFNYYKENEANT
jgi:hypothetical protein